MKLTGVTPNLISDDLPRAPAFYRDVLGFTVMTTVPDTEPFVFVMLERDGVHVFLNDAETRAPRGARRRRRSLSASRASRCSS